MTKWIENKICIVIKDINSIHDSIHHFITIFISKQFISNKKKQNEHSFKKSFSLHSFWWIKLLNHFLTKGIVYLQKLLVVFFRIIFDTIIFCVVFFKHRSCSWGAHTLASAPLCFLSLVFDWNSDFKQWIKQ